MPMNNLFKKTTRPVDEILGAFRSCIQELKDREADMEKESSRIGEEMQSLHDHQLEVGAEAAAANRARHKLEEIFGA